MFNHSMWPLHVPKVIVGRSLSLSLASDLFKVGGTELCCKALVNVYSIEYDFKIALLHCAKGLLSLYVVPIILRDLVPAQCSSFPNTFIRGGVKATICPDCVDWRSFARCTDLLRKTFFDVSGSLSHLFVLA